MIAHLRGKVLAKSPQSVIVEAAGVGYEVAISIPGNNAAYSDYASFTDNHTVGTPFVKPYPTSSWSATQYYRFTCTGYNNGNYTNLQGPDSITRTVQGNGAGGWKFVLSKTGVTLQDIVNPLP